MARRNYRGIAAAVLAGAAAWVLFATVVAPWLIRQAYAGESIALLNGVIEGRGSFPVEHYLDAWQDLWVRATLAAATLAAALWALNRFPTHVHRLLARTIGRGRQLGLGELLWYAAIIGFAGGLVEEVYRATRHLVTHRPAAGFSWDHLWMAPVASTVATLLLAIGLHALARLGSTRVGIQTATLAFLFPAIYGVIESEGIPLYPAAEVVLAVGLTLTIARLLTAREAATRTTTRRLRPYLIGAFGLLAVFAVARTPAVAERWALRNAPEGDPGLPNVLLIILDTVRADHLGVYGYARNTTPNLDAWAQTGTVYDRAYATAPWTLPSHATMFTGRYPYELGTGPHAPLDDTYPTLAEVLQSRGYATAGFVANLGYTSPTSGLARGFAWYQAMRITFSHAVWSSWLSSVMGRRVNAIAGVLASGKIGTHVTTEFIDWLDRPRDRPFFAFLNYFDAHDPYNPPHPWYSRHGARRGMEGWDSFMARWYAAQREGRPAPPLKDWVARYDAGISYVDRQLGLVFGALEERGLVENTIVIITSDHGEHWGEHGRLAHGHTLYEPVLWVPLIVAYPGTVAARSRVAHETTLRDLPATILALAGVDSTLPGASFYPTPALAGGAPFSPNLAEVRPPQVSSEMRALIEDRHLYIRNGDGSEELYDLTDEGPAAEETDRDDLALDRFRAILRGMGGREGVAPRTARHDPRPGATSGIRP